MPLLRNFCTSSSRKLASSFLTLVTGLVSCSGSDKNSIVAPFLTRSRMTRSDVSFRQFLTCCDTPPATHSHVVILTELCGSRTGLCCSLSCAPISGLPPLPRDFWYPELYLLLLLLFWRHCELLELSLSLLSSSFFLGIL